MSWINCKCSRQPVSRLELVTWTRLPFMRAVASVFAHDVGVKALGEGLGSLQNLTNVGLNFYGCGAGSVGAKALGDHLGAPAKLTGLFLSGFGQRISANGREDVVDKLQMLTTASEQARARDLDATPIHACRCQCVCS
mmetsp:Transcript_38551/g.100872  ORF Transcript_38551/g.100872 Transcript_38551/m.100872 type:complete len:138 (+) Transcript_38551:86-499(+)